MRISTSETRLKFVIEVAQYLFLTGKPCGAPAMYWFPGVLTGSDDQSDGQGAFAALLAFEDVVEAELLENAECSGDVTVVEGAANFEALRQRLVGDLSAFEQRAHPVDDFRVALGKIGDGALLRLAVFIAIGLAQEDGWRRVAIGNGIDIHAFN